MPDEYDAVRRRLTRYERGLYFELGRARERGETPEKGWVRQFEVRTGAGARILDSARTHGRSTQGVERKSGRVNERDANDQLTRERAALTTGRMSHSRWETVAGERLPDKTRKQLADMARDFPGRFQHEVVSRADAVRAIRLGQSLMAKQLELIRPYELDRADRARKRLEKIREIVRARENQARENSIERHSPAREPAHQQAREIATPAHQTPARGHTEAVDRAQREAAEKTQAGQAADAAALRRQQEAAQRLAETARQQREAARNGIHLPTTQRQMADILTVSFPMPLAPSPHREPPSPAETTRGRSARERAREHERNRERERGINRER
ncbi:hypothetical protein HGA13_12650 [Nocardia speluncae]|uniref:Uncharacterized protein n=1 Tax=Nocardia speluncae TaxID=419477 RepID=A0A846XFG4_9NOCA|nr:hypothetical protein [Nocardia speluncae]NKY33919.1 hypothetical protein [Nocardia speluncae]